MEESFENRQWVNITEEFTNSVEQLELGELVKSSHVSLFVAMSAIELMDPKMDNGVLLHKYKRKILNAEQSIKSGMVKVNGFQFEELVGIIDETYSCFATWLEGHHLAQTVMTNIYLLEPDRVEDRTLRIYSQSILKLIDFMEKLVELVMCVEEEDFQLNSCKFNLANQISDKKVLDSLEDVCQHYEKLLSDPQTSESNHSIVEDGKQSQQQHLDKGGLGEYSKEQLEAIINRFRFTYHLYYCFYNIHRNVLKEEITLNSQNDAQLQKTIKLVQQTVTLCDQHLEKCSKYLDNWEKTIDLGIKANRDNDSSDVNCQIMIGFDSLVNYKLLGPSYPKSPAIKTRPESINYLRDLIIKLRECFSVSKNFGQKSFDKSLESIEKFSKYFRPKSCVISRSLVQVLYLPNRSEKLLSDELIQSMLEYCEPIFQAIRKDEAKLAILNQYVAEGSKSFSGLVTMYGHNTARQHEKLSNLVPNFKNLQYFSLLTDRIYYYWSSYHLARISIKYILTGLELELYSTHEYPYVFWFLYEVLFKNERDQLELAKNWTIESLNSIEENNKKAKQKKHRKKNQYNTVFQDKCLLINDAFRFITAGLFLLTYGLKLQGKIKTPVVDFTSEEICFSHRFEIVEGGTAYKLYKSTLERLERLDYIYREALECFSEAKGIFQVSGQYEDCVKVCKSNMVVTKILSTNQEAFTDRDVEFSFESHPSLPTVKF